MVGILKKVGMVALAVLILLNPVSEIEAAGNGEVTIVTPRNDATNSTTASLSISSGTAYVTAKTISYLDNTSKIFLHVYLQQYVNGSWQTYQYWVTSSQTRTCTFNGSIGLNAGYNYRVKVSSWVMGNGNSEQIVVYSNSKWY